MNDRYTVGQLADDLGLPASALLEECHRLGIDVSWAGSELEPVAVGLLRERLARPGVAPARPRSITPPPTVGGSLPPTAAGSFPAAVGSFPPPAVGSLPGAVGGVGGDHAPGPGPGPHGEHPGREATEVSQRSLAETAPRRFDPTARTALIAAALGAAALVAAPSSPHVVVTALAWLAVGILGLIALISGNRSRYKISTHPEKYRGMPVAIVAMVAGVGLVVAVGAGTWVVTRDAPASAAPDAVGERADVAELRWAFHRVSRIKDSGWHRPVKDPGTCWVAPEDGDDPRDPRRVEETYQDRSCRGTHDAEVLAVFAVDEDVDAPYPGPDALQEIGRARCAPVLESLAERPDGLRVVVEYPTAEGWDDADHDVACVASITRKGSLTDS